MDKIQKDIYKAVEEEGNRYQELVKQTNKLPVGPFHYPIKSPKNSTTVDTESPHAGNIVINKYPDNNPKTVLGLKKPSLSAIPPAGMFHLGLAMDNGRNKYGAMNWREKKVSNSVYYDAALRHLLSWYDGEDYAEDSGVHHLGHAMACLSIVLDAMETGNLNDDRPHKGVYSKLVDKYVKDKS